MNEHNYLQMQQSYYDHEASRWSLQNRDPVVGWYAYHERHADYDTMLFKDFDTTSLVALEYGCGPGRNLVRFAPRFQRVDGLDISAINLDKAALNLRDAGIPLPNLIHNDGQQIPVPDATYDVVFSVICLQHICVHSIRYRIMSEIYRVLKPQGYFCAQMGFGGRPESVSYYDNHVNAQGTNGFCDVTIEREADLQHDLATIGFREYRSDLRPPCQDRHAAWIWFQVTK